MRTKKDEAVFQTMRKIRKRLNTLENKASGHCGHDDLFNDFMRYEEKVLEFIELELKASYESGYKEGSQCDEILRLQKQLETYPKAASPVTDNLVRFGKHPT